MSNIEKTWVLDNTPGEPRECPVEEIKITDAMINRSIIQALILPFSLNRQLDLFKAAYIFVKNNGLLKNYSKKKIQKTVNIFKKIHHF